MRLNAPLQSKVTAEGAKACRITPEQQLNRTLMACMLWEDNFYENGEDVAERIKQNVGLVSPEVGQKLAIDARTVGKLRHAPLLVARAMAALPTHRRSVAATLEAIIQRPDELCEFLAMYWKNDPYVPNKKQSPLSNQVKVGLAAAFRKFNEYQLAKYNRDNAIKLKDVLFLCHAKPRDEAQDALWKRLINNELATPDTWEVELSASKDKYASWKRLLEERKLGALALIRNLRNMKQAGVENNLIGQALSSMSTDRVLPFRFITAARHNPEFAPVLEQVMLQSIDTSWKFPGKTKLVIDVSGSMDAPISRKSEMTRRDAACGLAVLAREVCEEIEILTFSNNVVKVKALRGFPLSEAINRSQPHGCTYLGKAMDEVNKSPYDRVIVFTDEQSHDRVPAPMGKGYMINVAAEKNGVGYGAWAHIDGFSESIIKYIQAVETQQVATNE